MQMKASRREKTLKRAEIIGIARCSEILKYQLPRGYNNQLYIELETHPLECSSCLGLHENYSHILLCHFNSKSWL